MALDSDFKAKRSLKIHEAAAYAGVSPSTIRNWIDRRFLPFENLPGRGGKYHFRRIRRADLDEFLNSNYRPIKAEQPEPYVRNTGNGSIFLLPK